MRHGLDVVGEEANSLDQFGGVCLRSITTSAISIMIRSEPVNRSTNRAGWILPNSGNASSASSGKFADAGAAVSRTTYAALFAAIGTTYGSGDGSTTFNLPDLRLWI